VLVGWDRERTVSALRALEQRLAVTDELELEALIVDNHAAAGREPLGIEGSVTGDNSALEFSALEHGIRIVCSRGRPPDVWIFANDRMMSYGRQTIDALQPRLVWAVGRDDIVAGQIDYSHSPLCTMGHTFRSWIRSNLLLLSHRSLERVAPLVRVTPEDVGRWIGDLQGAWFAETPQIDPAHAQLLRRWLLGVGDRHPGEERWYRASPGLVDEPMVVHGKVAAILNEQLLSARCRDAGFAVTELRDLRMAEAKRVSGEIVRSPSSIAWTGRTRRPA
jgi:hypothetical protein